VLVRNHDAGETVPTAEFRRHISVVANYHKSKAGQDSTFDIISILTAPGSKKSSLHDFTVSVPVNQIDGTMYPHDDAACEVIIEARLNNKSHKGRQW
jgi:hypothetical protein